MKKTIFAALMLLGMSLTANAQHIKWNGPSSLEWQFKRCYVKNDKCILDLLVTNNGTKNLKSFLVHHEFGGNTQYTIIYDDEGNNYEYWYITNNKPNKHIINEELTINGQDDRTGTLNFELPVGVTAKVHLVLNDFDEFATKLQLVRLMFSGDLWYNGYGTLEIRDVPVTRE